jgi:hypothetical protein
LDGSDAAAMGVVSTLAAAETYSGPTTPNWVSLWFWSVRKIDGSNEVPLGFDGVLVTAVMYSGPTGCRWVSHQFWSVRK